MVDIEKVLSNDEMDMDLLAMEVGSANEKAQYLLDEIIVEYFGFSDPINPTPDQCIKLHAEFRRLWMKLLILADLLKNIDALVVPIITA